MFNKSIFLALPMAVALFVAEPANAGELMSTKQIKSLFPGSFKAVVHGVVAVHFTAYKSGRLKGVMGGDVDRGSWSVRGGVLCVALNRWMDGKARCARVTKVGSWYKTSSISFKKM